MHSLFKTLAMAGLLLGLGACSTASWYGGLQYGANQACRQPQRDGDSCRARVYQKPYQDYAKERDQQRPAAQP